MRNTNLTPKYAKIALDYFDRECIKSIDKLQRELEQSAKRDAWEDKHDRIRRQIHV